jgi:hypothetical protein
LAKARKGEADDKWIAQTAQKYGSLTIVASPRPNKTNERIIVLGSQQAQEKNAKDRKQVKLQKEGGGWKIQALP